MSVIGKNFYINGEWIKPNSHEEITVIDPATEENCAVITLGNKIDIDMAVIDMMTEIREHHNFIGDKFYIAAHSLSGVFAQ